MDNALKSLLTNAEAADWTMSERAYTFDVTVNSFRKALTGSDVTAALQEDVYKRQVSERAGRAGRGAGMGHRPSGRNADWLDQGRRRDGEKPSSKGAANPKLTGEEPLPPFCSR